MPFTAVVTAATLLLLSSLYLLVDLATAQEQPLRQARRLRSATRRPSPIEHYDRPFSESGQRHLNHPSSSKYNGNEVQVHPSSTDDGHRKRFIVTFKKGKRETATTDVETIDTSADEESAKASTIAGETHAVLEDILSSFHGAILVDNGDSVDTEQALKDHPTVETVVIDFSVQVAAQTQVLERMGALENDSLFNPAIADNDCSVDADVAVLDTGIDLDHSHLNVVAGVNCATGQCLEGEGAGNDDQGHGTFVAGIIGARYNNGIVGIAPGVRLWSIKVLDDQGRGWASHAVKAVDYVINNTPVSVMNFSFGGRGQESEMCNVLARAAERGVTFAASAGNDNGEDVHGYWPANCPYVLSVGSMVDTDGLPGSLGPPPSCRNSDDYLNNKDDSRSFFSNVGANITAVGTCVKSTLQNGGYGIASGTSMAAPAVAGALAVLSSQLKPSSLADARHIYSTVLSNGQFDWTDGPEPRLDLRNEQVFEPKFVGCNVVSAAPSMRETEVDNTATREPQTEDIQEVEEDFPDSGSSDNFRRDPERTGPCTEDPDASFVTSNRRGPPKSKQCRKLADKDKDRKKYCQEGSPAMTACPISCLQCVP